MGDSIFYSTNFSGLNHNEYKSVKHRDNRSVKFQQIQDFILLPDLHQIHFKLIQLFPSSLHMDYLI